VPYSYQTFNGGAAGLSLAVTVPFLLRAHMTLLTNYDPLLGTSELLLVPGYQYEWVSDSSITMLTSTAGKTITLVRTTPTDDLLVGWTDGSNIDMDDLLTADRQNLYAVQEIDDANSLSVVYVRTALGLVSDVLPYTRVANVSLVPVSPINGQILEVGDSTGIAAALAGKLTGMPVGFVGGPSLPVRLMWSSAGNTWQWLSYTSTDPDSRYAPIGSTGSRPRVSTSYTTGVLAQYGVADFTMNLGKLAELVSIQVSQASWVRIYRSSAQRAADTRSAPGGTLQAMINLGDNKPYSENVTTSAVQTVIQNPVPTLQGDSGGLAYVRLIKQSTGSSAVTFTATTLPQEN
jgi:Phage T7 tail fibre protein